MNIKKIAACVLCIALCCSMFGGCSQKSYDFRCGSWGDSPKEVSKAEDTEYVYASDDLVEFLDTAYDKDAEIIYVFENGGLSEGQIKFYVSDWILEDVMADFETTAAEMTEEFGEPVNSDYRIWDTEHENYAEHKDDGDKYGIYYHILEYKLEWNDGTTLRTLTLNYKDEQINYLFNASPVSAG